MIEKSVFAKKNVSLHLEKYYSFSYERCWWKQLSFCSLTLWSSFHQVFWCVLVDSRHWEVKRTTERAMSQRIKWFSAKTYKDRGCPIQVLWIKIFLAFMFGILYEILFEKQPILVQNSERKRKPSMCPVCYFPHNLPEISL